MQKKIVVFLASTLTLLTWALQVTEPTELLVAEGDTLSLTEYVLGTNVLTKSGAGKLLWSNPFTFGGMTRLEAGTIETDHALFDVNSPEVSTLLEASAFWLDANDEESFDFDENDNIVTWQDKLGRNTATSDQRSVLPTRNGTLNNLPTVDFGAIKNGASMYLASRLDKIRTVFWVVDAADSFQNFLLGDTTNYHFHRDTSSGAYWHNGNASSNVRNGRTYNNGALVATPTITPIPTGYQLISLVTTGNVQANALARDRTITERFGGQKIAEILIYEEPLSDTERRLIEAYLRQKWLPGLEGATAYNLISDLTIAGSDTTVASSDPLHLVALSHLDQTSVNLPQSCTIDHFTLNGGFTLNTALDPLVISQMTGSGTLALLHPLVADTLTLDGDIDINQSLAVTLLTGSGSLTAPSLQVDTLVPASAESTITLDLEAQNCQIAYLSAPQGGTIVMDDALEIGEAISVSNNQTLTLSTTGLITPLLTGHGTLDLTDVSELTIDAITIAEGEHLTIAYGTQDFTCPPLSGSGKLTFNGSGTLTINDPALFEGSIELAPDVELVLTGTHIALNTLEIHGRNTITLPGDVSLLEITFLRGDGELQLTNPAQNAVFSFARILLTDDLYLVDQGNAPLVIPQLDGHGTLTAKRPLEYAQIVLDGTITLPANADALQSLSGRGTLQIDVAEQFEVATLTLGGELNITNLNQNPISLAIDTLQGNGTLTTASLGELSADTVLAQDQQTITLNTGEYSATVLRSYGQGSLAKSGSGTLYFSQHSTLQALRINDNCKLVALPVVAVENPVQEGLSFWLDATASDSFTLAQDPAGNDVIGEWRDVRDPANAWSSEDSFNAAYQETPNAAPIIHRLTLNGLDIADLGPIGNHNDGKARWMQFRRAETIRSVIMVMGSQEGGNFLLTSSDSYNYHRSQETGLDYPLNPLFNGSHTATPVRNGQTFLDGLKLANPTTTGFNGNYQIISVINADNGTTTANRLARDRSEPNRTGGQRLAEILLYNVALNDTQRMAIEGYLTAKWRPRIPRLEVIAPNVELDATQAPLTIDVIVGPGNAVKYGTFDLTVQDAGGLAGVLHIAEGKLASSEALYRQTSDGLNNWYDASATDKFEFEEDGRIKTWQSRVGSSHAQRRSSDLAFSPDYDPYGLNGQPVVDMGVWNGQRHLRLTTAFNAICTAFMVYDSRHGGGWLFGGHADYHFHRGDAGGDLSKPMLYPDSYNDNARYANLWQDGVQTATDLTQAYFKGDWETIIFSTSGAVSIGSLGQDRIDLTTFYRRSGGKRLAEVLLYTRTTSTMERRYTERYLNNKWFGRFRNLAFADNTTFELADGTKDVRVINLSGTGRVVQSGTGILDVHNTSKFQGTWVAGLDQLNLIRKLTPNAPQPIPETWWLDASRLDTVELADGSYATGGVINNWRDLSVAQADATRQGSVQWKPDMLNGLPVVDLGPDNADNYMTYTNREVATGFVIFDSSMGGSFFFGHTSLYNFHRSNNGFADPTAPLLQGEANDWALRGLRWGQWKINGERYDPRNTRNTGNNTYGKIPPTYALYSFATRGGALAQTDQLARDRTHTQSKGGRQRLGEIIFHGRIIQPAERAATEAYLMYKWFGKTIYGFVNAQAPLFQTLELPPGTEPDVTIDTGEAGEAVAIGTLIGATNIVASGHGQLIVGSVNAHHVIASEQVATITGRTLPLENPVVDTSLELWVDASSPAEAFDIANNGRITRWSDVRDIGTSGRAMFAFNDGTKLWHSTIQGPILQANALNGKPIADFGAYDSKTWMGFVTGYNAIREINNIRTVFWVYNSEEGGGWLFGHTTSYHFHRGYNENNPITTKELTIFGAPAHANNRLGSFYIDGTPVNPMYATMSGGWELFSLKTQGDVAATTFARDRSNSGDNNGNVSKRSGGQKLAEMLIYSRPLLESERRDVEAYLAYKWFNRVEKGYRYADAGSNPSVAMAEGATLLLDGPTAPLKIAGSGTILGAPALVNELAPTDAGLEFASGLTLADGTLIKRNFAGANPTAGQVAVQGSLQVLGGGQLEILSAAGIIGSLFPLFTYDTLSGTFDAWQLTGSNSTKYKGAFNDNQPANTASVKFNDLGTILILR